MKTLIIFQDKKAIEVDLTYNLSRQFSGKSTEKRLADSEKTVMKEHYERNPETLDFDLILLEKENMMNQKAILKGFAKDLTNIATSRYLGVTFFNEPANILNIEPDEKLGRLNQARIEQEELTIVMDQEYTGYTIENMSLSKDKTTSNKIKIALKKHSFQTLRTTDEPIQAQKPVVQKEKKTGKTGKGNGKSNKKTKGRKKKGRQKMIDIEFFSVDLNNVPLSFDFDILGKSFKLLIKYNSFDKKYYCDLMTTNRETIIQNEPIIENRPLFWGYLYDMDSFVNIELPKAELIPVFTGNIIKIEIHYI